MTLSTGPGESSQVRVLVADNQWCDSHEKLLTVRKAIEGIEHLVEYSEARPPGCNRILHLGHIGGVFLDGEAYRPYQLIGDSKDLRAEIVRLYAQKQQQ